MSGKNRDKKIFPETHVYRELKTMEKIVWKKSEKTFFYKHTNIVTKKSEEKNGRKKFSKNTRIGYPKNVGKKSSQKSAKTRFL